MTFLRLRLPCVVLLAAGPLGAGLVGCGADNVQTCMQECEDVNQLECTPEDFLDCDSQCPSSWNERGLDYTEYLVCSFDQYGCNDDGDFEYTEASCDLPRAGGAE